MDMVNLGLRILKFFNFLYNQKWEGSICWYENEYHVTVTCDGNIYSYGQKTKLSDALDDCLTGLKKGGF